MLPDTSHKVRIEVNWAELGGQANSGSALYLFNLPAELLAPSPSRQTQKRHGDAEECRVYCD